MDERFGGAYCDWVEMRGYWWEVKLSTWVSKSMLQRGGDVSGIPTSMILDLLQGLFWPIVFWPPWRLTFTTFPWRAVVFWLLVAELFSIFGGLSLHVILAIYWFSRQQAYFLNDVSVSRWTGRKESLRWTDCITPGSPGWLQVCGMVIGVADDSFYSFLHRSIRKN